MSRQNFDDVILCKHFRAEQEDIVFNFVSLISAERRNVQKSCDFKLMIKIVIFQIAIQIQIPQSGAGFYTMPMRWVKNRGWRYRIGKC